MKLLDTLKRSAPADVFTETYLKTSIPGTDDRRFSLVKRWMKSGDLIRLKRGIYVFGLNNRKKMLNPYQMAQWIYGPSYISMESALSYHGWIPEAVYSVTSACSKRAAEISTPEGVFTYTPVKFRNFYAGVNRVQDESGAFLMASPWRALADYVYVYRKDWKSLMDARQSLRIEEESIADSDMEMLTETLDSAVNRRVRVFLENCKKEALK